MSDITITISAWPILVAAVLAGLLGAALVWAAWRVSGWRRWLAGGVGLVVTLAALALLTLGGFLAAGW